jgi:hypothetical protein
MNPVLNGARLALGAVIAFTPLNVWALSEVAADTAATETPSEAATQPPADESPAAAPADTAASDSVSRRPAQRLELVKEDPESRKSLPVSDSYDGPPLLLKSKLRIGGYGGVSAAYTQMLGRAGTLVGMEGAVLLDHRVSIGFAGYGFTGTPRGPDDVDGSVRHFGTGYGGVVARFAWLTRSPVYLSVGALVGGGAVTLQPDVWNHENDERDFDEDSSSVDTFFVVQPELTAHVNLTRWMRFGATAGYRFVNGVSRFGFEESDIGGVVLGSALQLGWL